MTKKILIPIQQNGVTYRAGDEDALQNNFKDKPELLKSWRDRALIEGDWEGLDPSSESGSTLEDELVQALLPHVGERGPGEGAVQALKRIIGERDEARGRVQVLEVQKEAAQQAADAGYEAVTGTLEKLKQATQERGEASQKAQALEEESQAQADVLEEVAGSLSAALSVERWSDETPLQTLQRAAQEPEKLVERLVELRQRVADARQAAKLDSGLSERTKTILSEKFGGRALETVSEEELAAADIAATQIRIIRSQHE